MKDYSLYILPAYAITALVFVGLIWASLAQSRRWRKRLEALSDKD